MQPFSNHTGIAVPLLVDDLNTDQIAPVQAMRDLKPDYKELLFMRTRAEEPDFLPHGGGGPAAALEHKEEQRVLQTLLG